MFTNYILKNDIILHIKGEIIMDENQNKKRLEYLYQQKEEIEKEIRIL